MADLLPYGGNGGGGTGSMLVGTVTNGTTAFPTHRPDGSALIMGDYVKPLATTVFPLTIEGVTLTSVRDSVVYLTTGWVLNANPYQNTSETPVTTKLTESMSGTANFQNQANIEFKTAINARVEKSTVDNKRLAYIRDTGVEGTLEFSQTASANTIAERYADGRLKVGDPVIDADAATKKYVDEAKAQVDNTTIDYTSDDKLEVKDLGVSTAKLADNAVTTVKIKDQNVTTAKIADANVTEAKLADNSVTTAKIKDQNVTIGKIAPANISTAIPSTGAVDTKLTTEKAVKDLADTKVDKSTDTTSALVYTRENGNETTTLMDTAVSASSIVKRWRGGTVRCADPISDDCAATKRYVDSQTTKVDNVTIDLNASNEVEVKDEGISLAKFAKHIGDEGKAYTIATDGTTELTNISQYKRVSTFNGEIGNTYTYYYLDTICVVGTTTYEVGDYVWDAVNGFVLTANIGGGSTASPILVGVVSAGDSLPTTRPDGSALIIGDYVKPNPSSTFPISVGSITFTSAKDTAVYMTGGNWLLNASVYQKTNETPVYNKTTESIDGASSTAIYQAGINQENATAINAAAKTVTFEKSDIGKIKLNVKDRKSNDIINKEIEKVVFTEDEQTLTNKTIEAKDNKLDPIIETTSFPASSAKKSLYYNTSEDEVKFTRDGGTTWHDLGGKAIIDVTALPTTGIKSNVYYRTTTTINPTVEGYYTLTSEKSSNYSLGTQGIYLSLPGTVYATWEQISDNWNSTYSSWFDRSSTTPVIASYAVRYTFDSVNYYIVWYNDVPSLSNVIVQHYKNNKWYEIVGTNTLQTLKYKSIDADDNAISNLEVDNLKAGVLDTVSLTTTDNNHVASSKLIYDTIQDAKRGFKFTGYLSAMAPSGSTLKEDELWYETTDTEMPTIFPIQVHRYSSGTWTATTEDYTPDNLDLWANKNNNHGYYYFGNAWNLLDFNAGVDDITIHYNLADKLEIKDLGVTKAKLSTALFSSTLDATSTDDTIATSKTIYDNLKTYAKQLDVDATNKKMDLKDNDGNVLDTVASTEISDITKDDAVTLTNKTLDIDNNTMSNVEVDNFKDSAVSKAIPTTGTVDTKLTTEKAVRDALDGKIDHYETMPTASADYLDDIVEYIGATDTQYTNGYFYKCQEVTPSTTPATYEWINIDVQNNAYKRVSVLPATGESNLIYYLDTAYGTNPTGFYLWNASAATPAFQLIANVANTATGAYSLTIEGNPTSRIGAINIGNGSTADAFRAVVLGDASSALGQRSLALGYNSEAGTATNNDAIAIGANAIASGADSIAIGSNDVETSGNAVASATNAIQIGNGTNAIENSLQVNSYPLLDTSTGNDMSGKVFYDRLADKFTTMPTASATYADGKIYQFIGTTTTVAPIYTHGYFYECKEDTSVTPSAYDWVQVEVQPVRGVDNVTIDVTSDDKLEVMDGTATTGITVAKMNTTAFSTTIADASTAVDTKLTTEKAVRTELDNKIDKYTAMPSTGLGTTYPIGLIVEFVGSDASGTYVNGYFYKVVADASVVGGYKWEREDVQPNYKLVHTLDTSIIGAGNKNVWYYLDTPYVTSTGTSYAVGSYIYDGTDFIPVGNASTTGNLLVGTVDQTTTAFPTQRPDGTSLVLGDYVKPKTTATFPFTLAGITFSNVRDQAIYMSSGNWVLNASPYQNTGETPVNDKTVESINGTTSTAAYQKDINVENVAALKLRLEQISALPAASATLSGKIYQFIGATTADYTHGYIYECQAGTTAGTYEWVALSAAGDIFTITATPTSSTEGTIDKTDAEIRDAISEGKKLLVKVPHISDPTTYYYYVTDIADDGSTLKFLATIANPDPTEGTDVYLLDWNNGTNKYTITLTEGALRFQFATMPTATVDLVGKIYQYTGTTTTTAPIYNHGKWYECKESTTTAGTYYWEEFSTGGGTLNGVDLSGTNTSKTTKIIWEGTQDEYDALTSIEAQTLYCITDSSEPTGSNYYTKTETDALLVAKQDKLYSATNIKSINGNSLLGSGDLMLNEVPSVTGYANKFLTTDGVTASWGKIAGNISDLVDDTATYPLDKADTLTGLSSTVAELNFSHGVTSNIQNQLNTKLPASLRGAANGIATLDGNKKVPLSQIPDALLGNLKYQGTWNASTGNPPVASPEQGQYWTVSTPGTYLGVTYLDGDFIICDSADPVTWGKVDNTGKVVTVEGRSGAVTVIDDSLDSGSTYTYSIDKINTYYNTLQPLLVSGTNIKTLNSESLLGSGNIVIDTTPVETLQTMTVMSDGTVSVGEHESIFQKTITADTTFSFNLSGIGTLTNKVVTFELYMIMSSVKNIYFPSNVTWISNLDLTKTGKYLFVFKTFDAGVTWIANLEAQW